MHVDLFNSDSEFGGYMTVFGFWVVVLAFLASVVSAFGYFRAAVRPHVRGAQSALTNPRRYVYLAASGIILASAVLLLLLVQHDYSNGYVYSYSSTSLPLHFLISSFYAGQEGSFLFWALCSVALSIVLLRTAAKEKSEAPVMAVFMGVQSLMLMLLIAKSPFRSVWEMIPEIPSHQIPPDGRGLNPLLQNIWMVIHPPVLFVGFAAMSVPFSFAVAGLWRKQYGLLSSAGLPWVLVATLVLGLGIMLGAYWAYGVLGWGGYWGWDPVENSSLIPWLTGMALLHTLLAQRRSMMFLRTNLVLAISSYLLVVYSTFLTRSGILGDASVHSFTDPGTLVYSLLIAVQAVLAVTGFGLLFVRRRELVSAKAETRTLSREMMLGAGALALILIALVVLFGTSLPIFSVKTVEPAFYDSTTLPLAIVAALLIGYSLYTQWGVGEIRETLKRSLKAVFAAAVLSGILYLSGVRETGMLLFAFVSLFALVVNLELAWKSRQGSLRVFGGKVAHIGLMVFFLGVISTGKYSTTHHLALQLDTPQDAMGYRFTYVGNHPRPDGKFAFNVRVEKDGTTFDLAPVMFDAGQQGIMRNPDIAASIVRDIYVSPVSLEQPEMHAAEESYILPKGESVPLGNMQAMFVGFDMGGHENGAMTVGSILEISNGKSKETLTPSLAYSSSGSSSLTPIRSELLNASIQLVSMNVGMGGEKSTVTVQVDRHQHAAVPQETLVVEASIKPFVALLWIGSFMMFGGIVLSIGRRIKE